MRMFSGGFVALALSALAAFGQTAHAAVFEPGRIDKNGDFSVELDVSDLYSPLEAMFVSYGSGPDSDADRRGQLALEQDYIIEDGKLKLSGAFLDGLHSGDHDFFIEVNEDRLDFRQSVDPGVFSVNVLSPGGLPTVTADEEALMREAMKSEVCIETMSRGYNVAWDVEVFEAENSGETEAIEKGAAGKDVAAVMGIRLSSKTRSATVELLREVEEPVALSVELPESLNGYGEVSVARAYTDGGHTEFSVLPSVMSGDGTKLFFENDKFEATFAILAGNEYTQKDIPKDISKEIQYKYSGEQSGELGEIGDGIAYNYETGEYTALTEETTDGFAAAASAEDDNTEYGTEDQGNGTDGSISTSADTVAETAMHGGEPPRERPYVGGYPDGSFRPENVVTRAELAQFIYNLYGDAYYHDVNTLSVFTDTADHWAEQALGWAVQNGYLKGCGDGTLRPSDPASRACFAVIMRRLCEDKGLLDRSGAKRVEFTDIIGHWGQGDILILSGIGLMRGYNDGTFKPDIPITRAEAVYTINKMLGRSRNFKEDTEFTDVRPGFPSYEQIMNAANGS